MVALRWERDGDRWRQHGGYWEKSHVATVPARPAPRQEERGHVERREMPRHEARPEPRNDYREPRAPSDATSRRPRVSNARKFARRRTRCAVMAGSRATTGRCRNAAINTPVRRRILRCGQKPRARLRQPSNVAANAGAPAGSAQ